MSAVEFTTDYVEEIADHEARIGNLEKRTDKLDGIEKNLERLTTLMEVQIADRKDSQRVLEGLTKTINGMNTKIDNTDKKIDNTDNKIDSMNEKLTETNEEVMVLKHKFEESENKNKIDIREVTKEEAKKKLTPTQKGMAIGAGGVAIIVAIINGIVQLIK